MKHLNPVIIQRGVFIEFYLDGATGVPWEPFLKTQFSYDSLFKWEEPPWWPSIRMVVECYYRAGRWEQGWFGKRSPIHES